MLLVEVYSPLPVVLRDEIWEPFPANGLSCDFCLHSCSQFIVLWFVVMRGSGMSKFFEIMREGFEQQDASGPFRPKGFSCIY